MPFITAWSRNTRRFLATHVARLSDKLADLTEQLRSSVAQIVGQVLVGAAREAISNALTEHRDEAPATRSWMERDPPEYQREADGSLLDGWYDDEPDEDALPE